jgi:transcription elongation factor Elf1
MSDTDEIDHEYTNQITCPYCGAEDWDSWECLPDETELGYIECHGCGRTFSAERMISVEYCTYKIDWFEAWERMNHKNIQSRESDERYRIWKLNYTPLERVADIMKH